MTEGDFISIKELLLAVNSVYDDLWVCDASKALERVDMMTKRFDPKRAKEVARIIRRALRSLSITAKKTPLRQLADETKDKAQTEDEQKRRGIIERKWISDRMWVQIEREGATRAEVASAPLVRKLERIRRYLESWKRKDILNHVYLQCKRVVYGRYVVFPTSPASYEIRILLDNAPKGIDLETRLSKLKERFRMNLAKTAERRTGPTMRMYSSDAFVEAGFFGRAIQLWANMREPSERFADELAQQIIDIVSTGSTP